MNYIAIALAILRVIPILDGWFQALSAAYIAAQIDAMKKENLDAIRKAIVGKDQRDLERAIGNPNPGAPSGDPGAVIVPTIPPGVLDP